MEPFRTYVTMWRGPRARQYASPALVPSGPSLRVLPIVFAAALAGLLIAAPSAVADVLTPESGGSPNADAIDTLYKITLAVAVPIFLLVEGVLVFSLFRYRFRRGAPEAAQVRGNTPLELGWTLGASAIVVGLAVVTFYFLGDIRTPGAGAPVAKAGERAQYVSTDQPAPEGEGAPLHITVNGQQYLWRYDYPGVRGRLFSFDEMVVPTDTTVILHITSQDVVHSWWIPKLGGKQDAFPGRDNETWFRIPDKPGNQVYVGQCAELCGENHAAMRARVRALPLSEYRSWAARQTADIQASQEALVEARRRRGSNQ